MNTSTIEARRSPGKRLGVFAVALAVACAGMFGLASSKAEATPAQAGFQLQFNDGLLNLGTSFVNQRVLPAPAKTAPESPTTLPNWWDIVDSIAAIGTVTGANVCTNPDGFLSGTNNNPFFPCGANPSNALIRGTNQTGGLGDSFWNPATGAISLEKVAPTGGGAPWADPLNLDIRFPIMVIPSPIDQSPIPITLAATSEVTGTFDGGPLKPSGTGELTLTPAETDGLEARVLVGLGIPAAAGGPQPFTYCKVPLPSATLSTGAGSGGRSYSGTPFTTGLIGGAGAVQASYTVPTTGGVIPRKQVGLTAPGADAAADAALEACATRVAVVAPGAGGIWMGNRTEAPACEEPKVGTYPNCALPKVNVSKIAVTGKKSVKRGKQLKLTVRVTNNGNEDGNVKVRLWSSNATVASVPGSVTVNAAAGSTGRKTVTVKAKKKKGKTTINASNGARSGKLAVKVK